MTIPLLREKNYCHGMTGYVTQPGSARSPPSCTPGLTTLPSVLGLFLRQPRGGWHRLRIPVSPASSPSTPHPENPLSLSCHLCLWPSSLQIQPVPVSLIPPLSLLGSLRPTKHGPDGGVCRLPLLGAGAGLFYCCHCGPVGILSGHQCLPTP